MSRGALSGLACLLLAGGCTVAGPRPGAVDAEPVIDTPVEVTADTDIRVGLAVGVPAVEVGGTASLEIVDDGGRVLARGPGPWGVRASGGGVAAEGRTERVSAPGSILLRSAGRTVSVDGTEYRGGVLIVPAEGGLTVINVLGLESYLAGVVPLEIGGGRPAEELEAVKAQAVAARTYVVRHLGRREALGFDVYGSVLDQAYGGATAEDPVTDRAVRETRGEILVHDGEPIEAFYHSTCGGRTAALEEVWDGAPRPYLRSVSDRRPGGGWYCESSSRFRWTETWSGPELVATLEQTLGPSSGGGSVTSVESLEILARTPSGRAEALGVRTNLGSLTVPGDSIRRVLRPEPGRLLNSTAIELHPHREDGRVAGLEVEGAGWGHGIGMCQVGALGRARAGHSYRDILLTYYPGSRIAQLYR